jgi:DNA-binding winged helix-turn-helix (wHTH) protein/tetratricopeptide (TPR) repeat protein
VLGAFAQSCFAIVFCHRSGIAPTLTLPLGSMTYRFDDFFINPATRELRRHGELVALPARAFDCLAYLIEHRERAVGRDELIAAVWGRVEISDALLSHTIVKIRRSLGDTGNEQRTIRTVPRFGYRWVQVLETSTSDFVPAKEALSKSDADVAAAAADVSLPEGRKVGRVSELDTPIAPAWRGSRRTLAIFVGVVVAIVALAARLVDYAPPHAGKHDSAAPAAAESTVATAVLVLPADVAAPDDWRWLRFGLMDLVANRLRGGAVQTAPSETVVTLLKQRSASSGQSLLHDASLGEIAALRVLPTVSLEQARWLVRLDAFGAQRSFSVEARADDAIVAGREAADALLRKLGHTPNVVPAEDTSPEMDELLQRSGAAMLADQLDQARALIAQAPAELQQRPPVEQRMAQIELRSGEYAAVETRLHALLDRLPPGHDTALRARALLTLAAAYVRQHQSDRAVDLYAEAIALRQQPADHEVLGVAHLGHGAVLAQKGRYDEATAELSRARTDLETVGDALGVASVDVNLGDFQLMRHRPADALTVLANAARQFERLGAREGRAYALSQQAIAEGELLDVDAALATSARFWPPEANTNNLRMRWNLVLARAQALAGVGRLDAAQVLIERIRNEADPQKDAVVRAQGELLAAGLASQRGDAKAAAALAAVALVPILRDADPISWTRGLLLQAQSLRDSDQVAAATAVGAAQQSWAAGSGDDWRTLYATLGAAEQAWAERRHEPALEQFAAAMQSAERMNVPEDLVAVGAPYLAALIEASQLDTARAVSGRIAMWADRDLRAASAQARLYRALGQDDAARKADETVARIRAQASRAADAPV